MKTNKILSILVLLFMFAGQSILAEDKPTYAKAPEDKPKLRWEYKYQEGETLYYHVKKKYNRPVFNYMGLQYGGEKFDGEMLHRIWIDKKDNENGNMKIRAGNFDFYEKNVEGLYFEGGVEGLMGIDGNIKGMNDQPIFLLSQPQFIESGLDLWSKDIKLFREESPKIIIGHYRVLEKENIFKGRKCVVIETEIGQVENGTDEEMGIFTLFRDKGRIKIKAKTWFDPKEGKIIKMEVSKVQGMKESVFDEATYELLDEKEIKKLDGIEDDWQLVLTGVDNFQLTSDNKIVYTKEETSKEKTEDGKEKDIKKSYIWICDADGSNQRRLTEGMNPVVSPDGKWVAVKRGDKLWMVEREGQKEGKQIGDNLIAGGKIIFWSLDSKKIGFNIDEKKLLANNKIEHNDKFGIFELETNKNIKLEFNISQISWLPDNNYFIYPVYPADVFAFGEYKYFLYDLKENKSQELKELSNIPGMAGQNFLGQFLPKEQVYLVFNYANTPFFVYFSPKYEIIKIEAIESEGALGSPRWRDDGKLLLFGNQKVILYNVSEHKIAWKQSFNFSPSLTNDFKWSYFLHTGKLSGKWSVYRIPAPKEVGDILRRN